MSNRKKKKWLTGSQQSETAFTEHSKLWLRTHRHTHEKKKENKNRVSRACFSFLRVLFFISLFLFKFPFTMASFFFALFQVLSPKIKKKKRCCDPSRKGTPHCRARKQHMNRASWKSNKHASVIKKKKRRVHLIPVCLVFLL